MNMKDLVGIINIYNAKIIFDSPEKARNKIINGASPLYFTPVDGKERIKYDKKYDKHNFKSTTAAIHIIDLSIDDLVNIFECDGSGIYDFTKEIIQPYYCEQIDENVVFTTFLFLHEIGHWRQFNNMDRNVFSFIQKDYILEKENFDKVAILNRQRNERIAKGNECLLTAKERKLLYQYMKEYRNIPKEKEADEFALSHMEESLKLYVESNL